MVNSASNPVPRGSIVSIYGTGGGTVKPGLFLDSFLSVAPPFGRLTGSVSATLAGADANVLYAGSAPFLAGVVRQPQYPDPRRRFAGQHVLHGKRRRNRF